MAKRYGKTAHELRIRTLLDELETAKNNDQAQAGANSFFITWHMPDYDLDVGSDDRQFQLPAGKRARVVYIGVNNVTEGIAGAPNSSISIGIEAGDVDAQVAVFLTTDVSVQGDVNDRDESANWTDILVKGVLPTTVAAQIVLFDTIVGTSGAGIADVNVVLEIFT